MGLPVFFFDHLLAWFAEMNPDDRATVIEPRRGKREALLPRSAILVFTSPDFDLFRRRFDSPPPVTHRIFLTEVRCGTFAGTAVALAGPMLGAPQTIMVLEKMIALGVREVTAVGWCGALRGDVAVGDVVFPSGTICEEGTSAHYPVEEEAPGPAPELLDPLRSAVAEAGMRFHEGLVWTTDAPFRETEEKVLRYGARGVLGVEMETSALFTVAKYRGIRLAVALTVSDDLSTLRWIHGFRDPRFLDSRQKLSGIVLDVVSRFPTGNGSKNSEKSHI